MTSRLKFLCIGMSCICVGSCAPLQKAPSPPSRNTLVLDQLVVFSDSALPEHHRLLQELRTQRTLLSTKLALPVSDEPIHVYLFPTADEFESFMRVQYPALPKRRAFFVETDTRLSVYAFWGDRVAEDLRHEVAHGYLHAVVPNLPLWLDEGLAEYFEVPRGMDGLNRPHVEMLTAQIAAGWRPDVQRLEQLLSNGEMSQLEYAESWAWVHFLLESSPPRRQLLHNYLQALIAVPSPEPIGRQLQRIEPQCRELLLAHLTQLRQTLR